MLSACSDDPPPSAADPTPTVTTTVEPTPTEAPETPRDRVPERAREQSRDGAIAFARYWIKIRNKSLDSLDTEDLRALSADRCETCTNLVELLEEMADNGGSFRGGKTTVLQAGSVPGQPSGEEIVELRIRIGREVRQETRGGERIVAPTSQNNVSVHVRWAGDGWITTWVRLHQ
ncbi:DUF6318 family protein [Nocardioides sp.]|uniref:DUF6318 family protein n=1 Tax=Nocardioides sp. TaxID=35761 RepID=UPI0027357A7A|nr:DUF6318 family protein [Nocardioides sp.]